MGFDIMECLTLPLEEFSCGKTRMARGLSAGCKRKIG